MPTFGHVFFGFCMIIPLMFYTKNKFNYKIAFIFLLNNLFGPDLVAYFFITPFHGILGFLIIAIPYSLVFTYGSRFSLVRSDKGFPLKLEDSGIREINWKTAYCVTAAGGFSHFFIDQFFHWELEMTLFSDLKILHTDILAWSGIPYHAVSPIMPIGDIIVIITLLLSLYFFKKGYKETFKLFLIVTGLVLVLMIFVSPLVYFGEREYAVILEVTIYIFLPLFLLLYADRNVQDKPRETPDVPKIERKKLVNIVAIISLALAIFFILYSLVAILMTDVIASLLGDATAQAIAGVITLGVIYLVVAIILLIGSIGLFFKVNICRYLAIAASAFLITFGFPIAIAFFLCEKDVKALFERGVE